MTTQAISHLQHIAFFHGLDEEALAVVEQASRLRQVEQGAFFFYQGDPAAAFYVLQTGRVRLAQINAEGQQVILRYAGPREGIGIIAVLDNAVYPVSAQAIRDCAALMWDGRTLLQLMDIYPVLAVRALRLVAGRFVELQTQYRELATERVERRVARALLRLVQQVGQQVEGGVLIDLPLSRQDLAEMTGTNIYNASRMLSKWEKQGIIESHREHILICDPHSLVAIAEDLPPITPPQYGI